MKKVLVLTEEQLARLLYTGESNAVVESSAVAGYVAHAFDDEEWADRDEDEIEETFPGTKELMADCRTMAQELIGKHGHEARR